MRFVPMFDKEAFERLKPVAGDLLDFQGTHYIAEQVGLKYVIAHLASDPAAKAMLKIGQVSKVQPEPPILPTESAIVLERDVRFL